ncbi:MAG: hypothetical protein EBU81_09750 [Proteobacteria bacterium]|nr:hypothetical protein [Pseudomonadota bacterium]
MIKTGGDQAIESVSAAPFGSALILLISYGYIKMLGSNGVGSWSGIIAALDWSVGHGISVVNLSLGSTTDPGFTVRNAFDNAAKAGVFIVASAGNSGAGVDTVNYPGHFDSVVAVGSTTVLDDLSSFSSTGPTVALSAPGSAVYSTLLGGGYGYLSGICRLRSCRWCSTTRSFPWPGVTMRPSRVASKSRWGW